MEQLNSYKPVVKAVESAVKQSDIDSIFYFNGHHLGSAMDLIQEPFGTLAGYSEIPMSLGFDNHSGQHPDFKTMMKFSVNPTIIGDYVVLRTASTTLAFPLEDAAKYGIPVVREDFEFEGWNAATVGNHAIDRVQPNERVGVFEGPEHQIDYEAIGMTDMRLYVKDFDALVPINEFGLYMSKNANMEQHLRNVIYRNHITEGEGFNPVTEAWIDELLEEALGPAKEIGAIGVGDFGIKGMAAGTLPYDKAILIESKDINDWASRVAEAYGLSGPQGMKDVMDFIWRHELFHVFDRREGRSKDATEIEIGDLLAEFYDEMAQTRGEKSERSYKAIRDYNKVYAEKYRSGEVSQENRLDASKLEGLIEKFVTEAESLGLEGLAVEDYVTGMLESEAKSAEIATDEKGNDKDAEGGKAKDYGIIALSSEVTETQDSEGNEEAADGDGEAAE
jgi:hypothetical protein